MKILILLNCAATVTEKRFSGGLISKYIILEVQNPHTSFESARSSTDQISKFDPKFDLSDVVHLLTIISSKVTEKHNNISLMKVSYPKVHALSNGTACKYQSYTNDGTAAFM